MIKLFSTLLFIIFLSSCSKSLKYPSWYLNPEKNNAQYLYGTGEGFDPEEAKYAGLSDVASRLKVSVASKFQSAFDEDSSGASSSISQKVSSSVEKISFNNYQILKSENTSHNTFIVLVGVETQKLIQNYTSEINNRNEMMKKLSNLGSGIIEKRNNLAKAVSIASDIESKIRILETINSSYDSKSQFDFMNKLKDDLIKLNSQITFKVVAGNPEIESIINYGLNKMNIGISNGEKTTSATIKISEQWITNYIMNSYFAKLTLNISLLDSNGKIIATKIAETSASSTNNTEMAKKMAISKMKNEIDNKGVMSYLGL